MYLHQETLYMSDLQQAVFKVKYYHYNETECGIVRVLQYSFVHIINNKKILFFYAEFNLIFVFYVLNFFQIFLEG